MKYVIVMPAFNESQRIGDTLQSLTRQTMQPRQLIVVIDNSTDNTAQVVESFAHSYPWIRLLHHLSQPSHAPGAKVVRAFDAGFKTIQEDFDFVVKMDADLELPPEYFERVSRLFDRDARVGIAGGIYLIENNGQWVQESYADLDHVKGPCKAYRKACFEAIGGLRESVGWDSVDEMLALYHGWKVRTDGQLQVKHLRHRGTETGLVRVMVKIGHSFYRMRYGLFIALISAGKAGLLNRPYVISGIAVLFGFLQAWARRDRFIVDPAEGRFIRRYRRRRMLQKLTPRALTAAHR